MKLRIQAYFKFFLMKFRLYSCHFFYVDIRFSCFLYVDNRVRRNLERFASHCLYLVLNTQETSLFYWRQQFWDNNDNKNICHWNHFQIPRALSELPANWAWSGQFSQKAWLGLAAGTLKGLMGFENNFNGIYFHRLKTGVSRNGLSPGYSDRDTSSVAS